MEGVEMIDSSLATWDKHVKIDIGELLDEEDIDAQINVSIKDS